MGRKSKYSEALKDKICEALIEGNTIKSICDSVNINQQTFYNWLANNSDFSSAIKKAEAKRDLNGELLAIHHIFNKMEDHWQAAAWWLERRFPNKYRNVQENKHTYDNKDAEKELIEALERYEASPGKASSQNS